MDARVSMPLFWRVLAINGAVFAAGTLILVLAPVTVSREPLWSEAVVLVGGLALMVLLNGLLLRSLLRPLDRLVTGMRSVDLREPGLPVTGASQGPAGDLISGFNEMVARLEEERRSSTAMALGAQEAERQRIAQELHDEVGQSLTAVLLELKRAADRAPEPLRPGLEEAREITRTSLEEVRRISQRLRPGVLAELGLLNSLRSLASDLEARSGIDVERGFAPGLPALTPERELVVYRVAQEALTNVARHSGARRVELQLGRRGDVVVLRVADDGRGLAQAGFGGGLQGMQERATLAGGTLSVTGRDGGGTEIRLEVPA